MMIHVMVQCTVHSSASVSRTVVTRYCTAVQWYSMIRRRYHTVLYINTGYSHSRAVVSHLTPSPRKASGALRIQSWRERHDCSGVGYISIIVLPYRT